MSLRNPTYNQLAQAAHAFGAATIVLAAGLFGYAPLAAAVLTVYCAAKEFWFDMHYETEEVSGGLSGGWLDFSFYLIGIVAALGLIYLQFLFILHHHFLAPS